MPFREPDNVRVVQVHAPKTRVCQDYTQGEPVVWQGCECGWWWPVRYRTQFDIGPRIAFRLHQQEVRNGNTGGEPRALSPTDARDAVGDRVPDESSPRPD